MLGEPSSGSNTPRKTLIAICLSASVREGGKEGGRKGGREKGREEKEG